MSQYPVTRFSWKVVSTLVAIAALLLLSANTRHSSGEPRGSDTAAVGYELSAVRTVLWHAGNFRYLNAMTDSLLTYTGNLQHPTARGYGKLSSTRKANFNLLLDSLFTAIDNSLDDGATGDWCGVKTKAANAGYEVVRFYDTDSGRWFVHGYDKTSFGQSYFFINPFAKRNLVIEVPHEGYDTGTAVEGARLFTSLAARALIINKEDRCSDPDSTGCNIGTSTACSDGRIRESDVAHEVSNTFQLLHVRFTNMDSVTKFVQLHGFNYDPSSHTTKAVVGDGSTTDIRLTSASVNFANAINQFVPATSAAASCQQNAGKPSPPLCGEANVQGRYSNDPLGDACANFTGAYGGRFVHVEQAQTLRDNDDGDGWYWGDIRDALILTWGDCNMNNGATDCTLGPQQTQYSTLVCP
jgi:hypothetical protein